MNSSLGNGVISIATAADFIAGCVSSCMFSLCSRQERLLTYVPLVFLFKHSHVLQLRQTVASMFSLLRFVWMLLSTATLRMIAGLQSMMMTLCYTESGRCSAGSPRQSFYGGFMSKISSIICCRGPMCFAQSSSGQRNKTFLLVFLVDSLFSTYVGEVHHH